MEQWFRNTIKKVMTHNNYDQTMLTVSECTKQKKWTPVDLILREYYNNGGGSSKGFLGISPNQCIKCYHYIKEHQQELFSQNLINKVGWNNWGIELWNKVIE